MVWIVWDFSNHLCADLDSSRHHSRHSELGSPSLKVVYSYATFGLSKEGVMAGAKLKLQLDDNEIRVLEYRHQREMTFRQIAEEMGYGSAQQAERRYKRTIKKLSAWRWMAKNDPELLIAAKAYSWESNQILRLYSILKKNGILKTYRYYSEEELLAFQGIGVVYVDFLMAVKYAGKTKPGVVKVQVNEAF